MMVVVSLSMVTLLRLTEVFDRHVLEFQAEVLGDRLATRQNSDVLEHRFPAIAIAWRLHRRGLQRAAELVDDQGRQRLAIDVVCDDQQRTAGTRDQLQQRQQILHRADPLFVDQDDRILQHHFHPFGVGDEVRRQVAAVELHPFDDVERRVHALGFFNGDDAVLAHPLHRLGDDPSDRLVVVRGDRSDLGDHRPAHRLGHPLELRRDRRRQPCRCRA